MDEAQYKVSVVTAVYNVEEYLAEAVDSIINQTLGIENIQLILVDDGSQDDSGRICDEYAEQYPDNIFVIHKENGGVSSARNKGLEFVKGEYVNFLDADDKLEADALEKMYLFMEENGERVDLVAIPFFFFDAKSGGHLLNYKFRSTRVVDLKKQYNYPQLSASATLIKAEALKDRRFDENMKYAEDAKLVTDIILDKMFYGVISNTKYLYRRRQDGGSAINKGMERKEWYIPYMKGFILSVIEMAKNKLGYIPAYIQYLCMYDLQWKIKNQVPEGVLSTEEKEIYYDLLIKVIQKIDNRIINEQKNIDNPTKLYLLSLKESNKLTKKIETLKDNVRISFNDDVSPYLSQFNGSYEICKFGEDQIVLEGYLRCFPELNNVKIGLLVKNDCDEERMFFANLIDRPERDVLSFCGDYIVKAYGFQASIPFLKLGERLEITLFTQYSESIIACKNISFGKFFPLDKKVKNGYVFCNNKILSYENEKLILFSCIDTKTVKAYERKFMSEVSSMKNSKDRRAYVARCIYDILARFKKKEIWIISDRLEKADDNGEAFFKYAVNHCNKKKLKLYFVIDKMSPDYNRMKQYGKVLDYNSNKYKIIFMLADKIISSQAEDYVFNRFFNMRYVYKDILWKKKFIFLQHGITKDNMWRWLNKYNKNIAKFVTATNDESKSILDYNYYYTAQNVIMTGFPRFDYLYDDSQDKKIITFMPTWRAYLTSNFDVQHGDRKLLAGFDESTYCRMYRSIFSNGEFIDWVENHGYEVQIRLHPAMPLESLDYLCIDPRIKIVGNEKVYREVYANSKLIITDYSSAVFDFAYLRKPVLYYQVDYDEFFSGRHTFDKGYFEYERDGFGEVTYTSNELIKWVEDYIKNDCKLKPIYLERINATFPYNDKENCKRVYQEILKS